MQPYLNVGQVFEFTASNGVKVKAVVIEESCIDECLDYAVYKYLCYAQNKLFNYYLHDYGVIFDDEGTAFPDFNYELGAVICDYCIIPEFDDLLII